MYLAQRVVCIILMAKNGRKGYSVLRWVTSSFSSAHGGNPQPKYFYMHMEVIWHIIESGVCQ